MEKERNLHSYILTYLALAILVFTFFKNLWTCDDTYIIFRSIEQLYDGNGPRWNPHERVQAYTSVLWFWLLALFRIFTKDLFLISTLISLTLSILLFKLVKDNTKPHVTLLFVLFITLSKGFFDFINPGLENPLVYLLLAFITIKWLKKEIDPPLIITLSILPLSRHDVTLIVAPIIIYLLVNTFKKRSLKVTLLFAIKLSAPLIIWSAFAIFYYGQPFPNTAYAKLNLDVSPKEVLLSSFDYFYTNLKYDTLTLVTIILLIPFIFYKEPLLASGITLYLIYLIKIGGDFMLGRFLSFPFIVSLIFLLYKVKNKQKTVFALYLSIVTFFSLYKLYNPPLLAPIIPKFTGHAALLSPRVADERGFYVSNTSIIDYLRYLTGKIGFFPSHSRIELAIYIKNTPIKIVQFANIGFLGYYVGTEKIVIDPLALTDPFLARIKCTPFPRFRPGHCIHPLPDGYIETLLKEKNVLKDPELHQLYEIIKSVTSDPLFSWTRLRNIVKLNFSIFFDQHRS